MVPLAHVIFMLDDSGSMGSFAASTQAALNAFIEVLKKCKGAQIDMSLLLYGNKVVPVFIGKPIQDVEAIDWYQPMNSEDIIFDAVVEAVKVGEKYEASKPCKTVVVVLADGGDTSSMNSLKTAKNLVTAKTKTGWQFNFIAAGSGSAMVHSLGGRYGGGGSWSGSATELAQKLGFKPECIIDYEREADRMKKDQYGRFVTRKNPKTGGEQYVMEVVGDDTAKVFKLVAEVSAAFLAGRATNTSLKVRA